MDMKPDEFKQHMENLKKPEGTITPPPHLRLTILNARASATFGIWVILIPALFLIFVLLKYYLRIDSTFLTSIEDFITRIDRSPATWFLQPILLLALPAVSIIINLLAITHVSWERQAKVLTLSMKLRLINILILVASTVIVACFVLYLLVENL